MITWSKENVCPCCKGSSLKSGIFCSKCEDESMMYLDIDVSEVWAKRLSNTKKDELFDEIKKYSIKHNYRIDMLIMKLKLKYMIFLDLTRENIYDMIDMLGEECV